MDGWMDGWMDEQIIDHPAWNSVTLEIQMLNPRNRIFKQQDY
jgi:hypothetical protein